MSDTQSNEDKIIGRQIAENLRRYRMARGYSQTDIAEVLGLSYQQIQKYERASNRLPAARLYRLAKFLDVPTQAFFPDFPDADLDQDPALGPFNRAFKALPEHHRALLYELAIALAKERRRKTK